MTELEHVSKEMVAMTTTLTMQDVGGDNGEPGQVGGASDRPGSAHDGSETDSQPVSVCRVFLGYFFLMFVVDFKLLGKVIVSMVPHYFIQFL